MAPGRPDPAVVRRDVRAALAEDIGPGDLTAGLIEAGTRLETRVISREYAILAGRPWFDETFAELGGVLVDWQLNDGEAVQSGQEVCRLKGDAVPILSGERTALNFIQTLSATATATHHFVAAVEGTGARILDTRKTIPGLRMAQKYAVLSGGGSNHRMGLFDAILVKENHISAAGSLTAAVRTALATQPDVMVEVEVENLDQLAEAVSCGAQRALLDNFELHDLRAAVQTSGGKIELEASGNVTLKTVRAIAETGVDFISTGAITKHIAAIDFSMRFIAE